MKPMFDDPVEFISQKEHKARLEFLNQAVKRMPLRQKPGIFRSWRIPLVLLAVCILWAALLIFLIWHTTFGPVSTLEMR